MRYVWTLVTLLLAGSTQSQADESLVEPKSFSSTTPEMSFEEFVGVLRTHIDALPFERHAVEYSAFLTRHAFEDSAELRAEYHRIAILFEMTRDGGPWKLRWDITNEEPSSKKIWAQWRDKLDTSATTSATAECDELSALFGWLASSMGIKKVGLVWPTSNHTIAAWEPAHAKQKTAATQSRRVLIPTSQIFLSCSATLDQTSFDPRHGRLGGYPGGDLPKTTRLDSKLTSFLLGAVDVYGGASPALLSLLRMHRNTLQSSSTKACQAERAAWAAQIALTPTNLRAMQAYAADVRWPAMPASAMLQKLVAPSR